jgi:ubiquinone/menaquinone biosynthesis C-methylase UbiE
LLQKNLQKFKEKWGFMNEEVVDMRFDLLKKIDISILRNDQEINILDIGCGLGASLMKIKEIIPKANIYGIEKSKEIISIIKDLNILTEVQQADNIYFKNLIFDVIILSKEDMGNCINNLTNNIQDSSQVISENEMKNQENIQFTGERLVINDFVRDNYNDVMHEHLSRYKLASKYVKDKKVIDAASGTGYGSLILSKAGAKECKWI